MSKCVIRPVALVRGPMEKSAHTYFVDFGQTVEVGYYVWYIEGPRQKIVVDAGVTAAILQAAGLTGRRDIQSLEEGLGKLDLKPGDIDIVIATHLHHDHISLAHSFTKAKFVVQQKELEEARNPHPIWARTYGLQKEFGDLNYEVIEGDKEIAEGVRVICTPGHTPGTQSVVIETADGLAVITVDRQR